MAPSVEAWPSGCAFVVGAGGLMAEELEERAPRAWRVARSRCCLGGWVAAPLLCYDISPVERAHLAPIPRRHRARARA